MSTPTTPFYPMTHDDAQEVVAALEALQPGMATSEQAGLLAPQQYIEAGSIKTATEALSGLMSAEQVKRMEYLRTRPHNHSYDGRNLKEVFASVEEFGAAILGGDFSKMEEGDYWPITISGTFKDYATSTTKTLTSAVFKMEVMINPYYKYGDSGKLADGVPHAMLVARDLIPFLLQFRSANDTWYDQTTNQPWTGSHLYQTLNNPTDGLVRLILASELGPYIYKGPNNKGMRHLMETKAKGATTPTSWGWVDRGILFLPSEKEVWGNATWSKGEGYGGAAVLQWSLFVGSRRHISKGLGDGGSRSAWWCESSYEGNAVNQCIVTSSGYPTDTGAAYTNIGVPLCFLLAANA